MSDRESWDDEVADLTRDDDDNDEAEETGANTQPSPDPHVTPPAPHAQAQPEAEQEQNQARTGVAQAQDGSGRGGKRAQRTRRIKMNPPGAQNPSPGSSPASSSPTGANPARPSPGQALVTESTSPQARTPAKSNALNTQNKSPTSTAADSTTNNPTPQSTPITIPPQITGFQQNHVSNEQVLDFDEDEPSRLLDGLCCLAATIKGLLRRAFNLLHGLLQAIGKVLMFPALLGGLLYFGIVYLLGTYVLGTENLSDVTGFEAAHKYVLLSAGWTVMPVFVAFVVIHFATNGPQHHQFLYESVIDALLLVFNGLIMSAHGSPDCIIWLGPVFIISAAFRLLYWTSLFYLGTKWQQVFKTPAVINCIMFSTNNLGASLRHCVLGYPVESGEGAHAQDEGSTESPIADAATTTQEQGFMDNPSMCKLMEAVFCDVRSTSQ